MHESAFDKFSVFVTEYLMPLAGTPLSVLDVGSRVIGDAGEGGHRSTIVRQGWSYCGLDIEPGASVDLVVTDGYDWAEIADDAHDVVLCSQVLEHARYPWRLVEEIARVLRPRGLAFLVAPSSGHVHRYPEDCFRYYPDGLPALLGAAGLAVIEAHVQHRPVYRSNIWLDAAAIAQKPLRSPEESGRERARRQLARLAARSDLRREDMAAIDFSPHSPQASPFPDLAGTARHTLADRDATLAARFDPLRRLAETRRHLSSALKALTRPV